LVELAGADGGAVIAALFPSAAGVECETAFDFFAVGMAFEAAVCEEGLDFVFEELGGGGRLCLIGCGAEGLCESGEQEEGVEEGSHGHGYG
jgi:hypothetical protein